MEKISYLDIQERTPIKNRCLIGSCPGIYGSIKALSNNCVVGSCPEIYSSPKKSEVYLVIGKQINPNVAGLEKKVGEGEVLIEVPKEIIDNMER